MIHMNSNFASDFDYHRVTRNGIIYGKYYEVYTIYLNNSDFRI